MYVSEGFKTLAKVFEYIYIYKYLLAEPAGVARTEKKNLQNHITVVSQHTKLKNYNLI